MIKVADTKSLYRDPASNAIINTDYDEYMAAKKIRQRNDEQRKALDDLSARVSSIEEKLNIIIQALHNK